MTSEEKRQFTARISQANKSELVVILFEMFDYCIEQAEDGFKTEDLQKADSYLKSAKGCVSELRGSLDMGYEISHNLYSIYTYVNRQLTASIIKRKPVNIDSVKENMEKLRKSFEEVAKQDTSGSVVQLSLIHICFTLMKQLKMENKYAHIPIIVTSQGGDKSVEKSFALGATDFVEKPYNPRIIMHRVQNVVMAYKNARSEAAATNEKNDSVS